MKTTCTIYHNPRCSKSRQALALLRDAGIEPTIIEYLKTPLSAREVKGLARKLGLVPRDLLRTGEAPYRALKLGDRQTTDTAIVKAIVEHPILLQRPIIVRGDRAVIGRPPEQVRDLLTGKK